MLLLHVTTINDQNSERQNDIQQKYCAIATTTTTIIINNVEMTMISMILIISLPQASDIDHIYDIYMFVRLMHPMKKQTSQQFHLKITSPLPCLTYPPQKQAFNIFNEALLRETQYNPIKGSQWYTNG